MEGETYDPMGDHAPDFHLRDGEREIRRKPQLEAERVRGIVRKVLSREKHPVVEDPRASQKRPEVSPAIKPAAIQCGNRLMMLASIGPKKKVPRRVPFFVAGSQATISPGRSQAGTS